MKIIDVGPPPSLQPSFLPVPSDFEGFMPKELLDPAFLQKPVSYRIGEPTKIPDFDISEREAISTWGLKKKIDLGRLKALGYAGIERQYDIWEKLPVTE